jgi:alkylhydroperoxidase/carboxymuconolactone decarboxylase family protein YurZ
VSDYERGLEVRREVLGDEHVDHALQRTTEETKALDRRTRSCITLTALGALGRFDELAMHIRGARRNGLSDDEIKEVLLHSAVYCGVPAANSAFAVFQRVLEEE